MLQKVLQAIKLSGLFKADFLVRVIAEPVEDFH